MNKTAFIGHREIFANDLSKQLINAIASEIKNGCLSFTMGTHGEFDRMALSACRHLRREYPNIEIEVVITSLNMIKRGIVDNEFSSPYSDVKTIMYEIEKTHFKRQITLSNRMMLDTCNTLICYVDNDRYRSGAKTALNYAKNRGMKIINLYNEKDDPSKLMNVEESLKRWHNNADKLLKR